MYDTHIATYLRPHDELFPSEYTIALSKLGDLRSGENPHQLAAFYAESSPRPRPAGLATSEQLHGKDPSFNNTYDADLAWQSVSDFTSTCVAIVKHGNLCGLSLGDSVADAFRKALATDPQTAFGSAVAANRVVDDEAAHEIGAVFFEDLVAPDYTREALSVLRSQARPARVRHARRSGHARTRTALVRSRASSTTSACWAAFWCRPATPCPSSRSRPRSSRSDTRCSPS